MLEMCYSRNKFISNAIGLVGILVFEVIVYKTGNYYSVMKNAD